MKILISTLALLSFLGFSHFAEAVVVDEFRCHVEIWDKDNHLVGNILAPHAASVRRPITSNNPDGESLYNFSAGEFQIDTYFLSYRLKFDLEYWHAWQVFHLPITRARQWTCLKIDAQETTTSCPMADVDGPGWNDVGVNENHTPLFEPSIVSSSISIYEPIVGKTTITATCEYEQTLE